MGLKDNTLFYLFASLDMDFLFNGLALFQFSFHLQFRFGRGSIDRGLGD